MPGPATFLDSAYFIALFETDSDLYPEAAALAKRFDSERVSLVSSEQNVIEVLNYFSRSRLRDAAGRSMQRVLDDPRIECVRTTSELVAVAIARYRRYSDKNWSMTDCTIMEIMAGRGINDIATSDHGFAQAGFNALML